MAMRAVMAAGSPRSEPGMKGVSGRAQTAQNGGIGGGGHQKPRPWWNRWHQAGVSSREKSIEPAEWVRAPKEMKSTPVRAISRTFAEGNAAAGFEFDREGAAQVNRFAHLAERHVIQEDDVDAGNGQEGADLVKRVGFDLDLDLRDGRDGRGRFDRGGDSA